jgi:hypothetical protein
MVGSGVGPTGFDALPLPSGLLLGLALLVTAPVGLLVGLAASKSFSDGFALDDGLVLSLLLPALLVGGGLTLRFGETDTVKFFLSGECPVARRFESRLNFNDGFLSENMEINL